MCRIPGADLPSRNGVRRVAGSALVSATSSVRCFRILPSNPKKPSWRLKRRHAVPENFGRWAVCRSAKVEAFPGQLADRFESEQGFDGFETTDGELRLKSTKGQQSYQLSDKQFKLTAGAAISLTSSVSAGMPGETQVGFEVDGIRIGLRSVKQGVEVFARDRGEESRRDPVHKIATAAETTTLSIGRDAEQPDTLHWFIESGDLIQTGTIGVTALGQSPALSIFVSVSKTTAKRPLWLSGLKTRSGQR